MTDTQGVGDGRKRVLTEVGGARQQPRAPACGQGTHNESWQHGKQWEGRKQGILYIL